MRARFSILQFMAVCLSACGGHDGDENKEPVRGQVTDPWRSYCTATFTRDYDPLAAKDQNGNPYVLLRAGDEYLVTNYWKDPCDDPVYCKDHVELGYLTSDGPATFGFDKARGSNALPFTSNCSLDAGVRYFAAFKDVTIYTNSMLNTKLCDLRAGSVFQADTQLGEGLEVCLEDGCLASAASLNGAQIFRVYVKALAQQCGAESGFITVLPRHLFNLPLQTWVAPLWSIVGPR